MEDTPKTNNEEVVEEIKQWDLRFNTCYWKWYDFKDRVRHAPGIRQLCDAWYYLKCALWHKYNRVHVKTLPPTWCDRCTLLPHAMFQILRDFVDRECSPGIVDWDSDDDHRKARAKMNELLNWWDNTYLKFDCCEGYDISKCMPEEERNTPIKDENGKIVAYEWNSNDYEKQFFDEANRKEEAMRQELTCKLKELIDLRDYLWT